MKLRIRPRIQPQPLNKLPGVNIGFPHYGMVKTEFCTSLAALQIHEFKKFIGGTATYEINSIDAAGSCYVAKNRNDLVRALLSSSTEWLLQLDTDIEFKPNLLEQLMSVATKEKYNLVSGLYVTTKLDHSKQMVVVPTLYNKEAEGKYQNLDKVPINPSEPFEVAVSGGGCLLVHRSVYEAMEKAYGPSDPWPWFSHDVEGGDKLGEDVTFCRRAAKLGFPTWAWPQALCRHHKIWPLTVEDQWNV